MTAASQQPVSVIGGVPCDQRRIRIAQQRAAEKKLAEIHVLAGGRDDNMEFRVFVVRVAL